MSVTISGSMAFDNIMVFQDQFQNHILPEKIHMLNVAFLTPQLRREFGGCAGNIAYNLSLLDIPVAPLATVGVDFNPYREWFARCKIDQQLLQEIDSSYTAQAYIITDLDNNQITAFHPGAMNFAHQLDVPTDIGTRLGMISPNGKEGMVKHARQYYEAGIPFIFDPGQGLPMFSGEELLEFFAMADWVAVNDYEAQLLKERTGLTEKELAAQVKALIITMGGDGSRIYTENKIVEIPSVEPTAVKDPTGCGDAYRAGIIYGLLNELEWEVSGRIAALMGAIKISQHGTQNHTFTFAQLCAEYAKNFGSSFAS